MKHSPLIFAENRSFFFGLPAALPGLLALLAFLGCAQSGPSIKHEHSLSTGQGYHVGLKKAILMPLNQVYQPVIGLDVADAAIQRLVTEYLESHGLEVETISQSEFNRAASVASREAQKKMLSGESGTVSDSIEFSDLVPLFLKEMGTDAELVVLPNVVQRSGAYSGGRMVRWDGVRRRERGTRGRMTGTTNAASLYTVIYRADGMKIFSGYGGLDLLFELNIPKKKYEMREDRLQDEEHLAEGICISFHPFFGDEIRCR